MAGAERGEVDRRELTWKKSGRSLSHLPAPRAQRHFVRTVRMVGSVALKRFYIVASG